MKKCLKIKENGRFSRKFLIHNHYEGRGRGLSDLLKLRDVSEAVKVRSKKVVKVKEKKLIEIGTFKHVSRNLH